MKKSFLLAIILFFCSVSFAQNELLVQSNEKGLYLLHTVSPKENFYSIGRLYNIPPKEIAALNALDMANGLSVGQTIQVPLNSANFTQQSNKGRPVYYMVGEKEGLYRVSTKNNKVLMADLRKWNNLSNDNISTGQKLIVGFLTSPEANNIVATNPAAVTDNRPVQNTDAVVNTPVRTEPSQPRNEPVTNNGAGNTNNTRSAAPQQTAINDGNGGYFKSHFEQQSRGGNLKDQTLTSGIFKTSSGWQDTRYYALIDNVEPGTIVRITNPTNSKTVYAKVLDKMAGIRQNQGLDVRISNAAASVLGVEDTEKFIVRVSW
ncbi:MAG TPA: LysM peptidoglycan-binding domain-containing protein [Flavisolibacter sp.]|jgi:LysM repeat protein